MSAGSESPSVKPTPATVPSSLRSTDVVRLPVWTPTPEGFDLVAQHPPTALVELLVHQVTGRMYDVDGHALRLQTVRGFETEQPAADHDGAHVIARGRQLEHAVGVLDGPEAEDAPPREFAVRFPEPSMFGKNVWEPVAMMRTSKSMTRPDAHVTVLAKRSIDSARSPAWRVTPCSRYHAIGLSIRSSSSTVASPARTWLSMMRL